MPCDPSVVMRPFGGDAVLPFSQLESLGEVEQDMAMDVDANGKPVRPFRQHSGAGYGYLGGTQGVPKGSTPTGSRSVLSASTH